MNPIETTETDIELVWDSFGINRCDFRPQWNGDLVNVFSAVDIRKDEPTTQQFMKECTRALARWIGEHQDQFGTEDRFQIIIGWPKSVRTSGRQTIKIGGSYVDLVAIASGDTEIKMKDGWSTSVFTKTK